MRWSTVEQIDGFGAGVFIVARVERMPGALDGPGKRGASNEKTSLTETGETSSSASSATTRDATRSYFRAATSSCAVTAVEVSVPPPPPQLCPMCRATVEKSVLVIT